eukprot:m.287271 g.287271  ORF g.287271 m.287271 type:complete len:56 (-) comp11741_c0_seq1:1289-1456(-)
MNCSRRSSSIMSSLVFHCFFFEFSFLFVAVVESRFYRLILPPAQAQLLQTPSCLH